MKKELCNCNECDDCYDNETETLIERVEDEYFSVNYGDFEDNVYRVIVKFCETDSNYQMNAVMKYFKQEYY